MGKRNSKASRNDNLIVLSHEHHHGLIFCSRLTKANKVGDDILRAYVLDFWEKYLVDHFANEEKVFLPYLKQEELTLQFFDEHKKLHLIIERIKEKGSDLSELIPRYRQMLYDHIRFEERVFFPWLEETLSSNQLEIVGRVFKDVEVTAHDFSPKFWEV